MSRPSARAVVVVGVLVALLLAGVVSFYASTSPDGLNRVAADQGFAETGARHATEDDSPLAGYETRGVADPRLSGGLAGVAGALTVLTVTLGLGHAVRRRSRAAARDDGAA